jgi:hypothetical protein
MSNRRKSFKAGKPLSDFEPVEFELNDQTFQCKPALQGAVLLEFVAKADGDRGGEAAGALYGFFKDCMEEEEYERFRAYLNSPDLIFDMNDIGEIASWLVEEYTARPTEQSVPSGTGLSSAGHTSTEPQSSVA